MLIPNLNLLHQRNEIKKIKFSLTCSSSLNVPNDLMPLIEILLIIDMISDLCHQVFPSENYKSLKSGKLHAIVLNELDCKMRIRKQC